jgi:hypothetical protein
MKRSAQLVLGICLFLLLPARAGADAITVQPGSGFVVSDFIDYWSKTFDNWGAFVLPDLTVGVSASELFANARTGCNSCTAGDTVNLSSSHELRGWGYFSAGDHDAIWGTGTLNFHAGDVVIPHSPATSVGVDLIVPFTFDGFISLYSRQSGGVVFTGPLAGDGYTRAVFTGDESSRRFHQQVYEFGENAFQPAPVPEPASLLLCSAGLAALVRRRMRRGGSVR